MKKYITIVLTTLSIALMACDGKKVDTYDVGDMSETVAVITDVITETTTATTTETTTTTQTTTSTVGSTTTETTTTSESATVLATTAQTYVDEVQSYNNAHQPTTTTTTVIEEEETLVTPELSEVVYEDNTVTHTDTSVNQMTYYSGRSGCKGASGRTLLNDYSCACNSIPLGTIIHIESSDGSVNGDYRVDDRGGMSDNVVDIFYNSYDNVPSSFRFNGRVSCTVWIVE
jgi:hypothetical protein